MLTSSFEEQKTPPSPSSVPVDDVVTSSPAPIPSPLVPPTISSTSSPTPTFPYLAGVPRSSAIDSSPSPPFCHVHFSICPFLDLLMVVVSRGLAPHPEGASMELGGSPLDGLAHDHHLSLSRRSCSRLLGRSSNAAMLKVSHSWVDLFSTPSSSSPSAPGFTLIPPSIEDVGTFVDYEEEDSCELENCWRLAIVGYVVGLKLSFKLLQEFISKVWKPKGKFSLHMHVGGFFVCNFSLEEDIHATLGGFWSIRGHPFLLQ